MDSEDKKVEPSAQATDHSIAIGKFSANGNTGTISITNVIREPKLELSKYHKTEDFEPETIYVAEGTFLMGSPDGKGFPTYEYQQHEVRIDAYRIGQYPVTNSEYEAFISRNPKVKVWPEMGWRGRTVPPDFENHPVVGVTWYDALAYCRWLTEAAGCKFSYTLPNEAQWEKSARGGKPFLYPWGDELDPTRSNAGNGKLAAVLDYPAQNDFGIHDLVGNIRQWTISLWGEKLAAPDKRYFRHPWENDGRNFLSANDQIRRVVKGSSFQDNDLFLRCSARNRQYPGSDAVDRRHGFRVVMIG